MGFKGRTVGMMVVEGWRVNATVMKLAKTKQRIKGDMKGGNGIFDDNE